MTEYDLETLVLLCLRKGGDGDEADRGRDRTRGPPRLSIPALAAAAGLEDTLADRLRLTAALSALDTAGLVTTVDDAAGTYRLTEAGRDRAAQRYATLETDHVVVDDGDERRDLPLEAVPTVYGVSIPAALSRQAPDGTVYLDDGHDLDLEPAFVGRENERDRLLEDLETAADGTPTAALVTGEPGIGKSTLVERLREDAAERGFDTAVGRCRRDGGGPYHPFRDAFDAGPGDDGTAAPIPGIDATPPAAHDGAAYEAQLEAFYDRVADRLVERATERPLALVLEDLQWADVATLDLLEHLLEVLEAVADAPFSVYCTARLADPTAGGTLADVFDAIERTESGRRVSLEPLEHGAIRDLLERHVGRRGVPQAFVDALAEETGGNPLFLVETVEAMLADGRIDPRHDHYPDDADAIAVADVVQTTVTTRLERLAPATQAVLEAGAVVGDVVSIDLLRRVVDHVSPSLSAHVDRLVEARLWRRVDGETVQFQSDVVRSVVRDRLSDDRAARLHRRIADAMTGDGGEEAHATIAAHYERGDEPDRALEGWLTAADRATELYAHEDAVEWYERALRLARDRDRAQQVLEILESLGDVYYTRGEYDRADKQFRYVRERTDDPERIRRTYRYQARVRFERGEYDETERYATEGLAVGDEDAVTREVCWLRDYHAGAAMKRGDLEAAIEGFETQRKLAAAIGDDLLLGRACQNLGICVSNRGESDRAVDLVERARSLLEAAGDERELARCLNDLATAAHAASQYDRAADAFERSRSLASEIGSPRLTVLAGANLGVIAIWQARWDRARSALEEATEVADRFDNAEMHGFALGKLANIERERGRLEDAVGLFERSREVLSATESPRHLASTHTKLGYTHVLRGSFDAAAADIDRALELAVDHDYPRWRSRAIARRGCLLRERGDFEAAIDDQREGLEIATADCSDETVANVGFQLAETLCLAGEGERALERARAGLELVPDEYRHLERRGEAVRAAARWRTGAVDEARSSLEALLEQSALSNVTRIRCLRELGLLEYEAGAPDRGRDRLAEGRALAAEIGATAVVDRFDTLLDGRSGAGFEPASDTDVSLDTDDTDRTDAAAGSDRGPIERDGEPGAAER